MVLKFFDRWPSKGQVITVTNEFTISFPVKTSTLITEPILKIVVLETINQTLFTHVLVD